MDVFTVSEGALRCCGIGCVQLHVGSRCHIDVEVLVADGKLWGFDLLLGFDIIKKQGGVFMTRDGTVSFPQLDRPVWSENQTPPELKNKATEYLIPKQLRVEFDNELRPWIDNGWMILYPKEECGPPRA